MKNKIVKIVCIVLGIVSIIFLSLFFNHKIRSFQELKYLKQYDTGKIIKIDNKKVNYKIFNENNNKNTIILMGGSGVTDLSLSFKPLADKLNAKVILVNRPGYGSSSDTFKTANIDYIVDFYRKVLKELNITNKVVLMPHSLSGIYAMYWAILYPNEIESIIGLDIGSPYLFVKEPSSKFSNVLSYIGSQLGIHRFIYQMESANTAIKNYGIYDDDYFKALWYMNTINPYSKFNLSEENLLKDNSYKVIQNINENYYNIRKLYIMANSTTGEFFEKYEKENLNEYYKNEEDVKKYLNAVRENQEETEKSLMLDSNTTFSYIEGPHLLYYYSIDALAKTINDFIGN